MTMRPHTCLDCGGDYSESRYRCEFCDGKGGLFCFDGECVLCEAIREELELFRRDTHEAQTLAVNAIAKRYGTDAIRAREMLKDADRRRPGPC